MSNSILPDGQILFPKRGKESETTFHIMLECAIALGYTMFEYKSSIYSSRIAIDYKGFDEDEQRKTSFLFMVLAF